MMDWIVTFTNTTSREYVSVKIRAYGYKEAKYKARCFYTFPAFDFFDCRPAGPRE